MPLLIALLYGVSGVNVTINNAIPRRDSSGDIMDAHDASVQRFPPEAGAGTDYWMHTGARPEWVTPAVQTYLLELLMQSLMGSVRRRRRSGATRRPTSVAFSKTITSPFGAAPTS